MKSSSFLYCIVIYTWSEKKKKKKENQNQEQDFLVDNVFLNMILTVIDFKIQSLSDANTKVNVKLF